MIPPPTLTAALMASLLAEAIEAYGPNAGAPESDLLTAAIKARAALSELVATRDPIVYSDALRALDDAIAKAEGAS